MAITQPRTHSRKSKLVGLELPGMRIITLSPKLFYRICEQNSEGKRWAIPFCEGFSGEEYDEIDFLQATMMQMSKGGGESHTRVIVHVDEAKTAASVR